MKSKSKKSPSESSKATITTGKQIRRYGLLLIKPAGPDSPVYKLGYVIGQTRLSGPPKKHSPEKK